MRSASHRRSSSLRSANAGTVLSCCARLAVAVDASISNPRQMGMHELNRDRTFADAGRDTLDRPMPYVAHRKHSGNARFQKEWFPLQRPAIRARALLEKVRSGEDKSAVVALDKAFEPFGASRRPDEHEQRSRRHPLDRSGTCAQYRDR